MKYTILIDDGISTKKITKIFTYSDGGFAVAVPYHSAKKGHLIKYNFDYRNINSSISIHEVENYTASDRVKLSIHRDGFVQFSGENSKKILSGIDESGKPKGLGYFTSPLSEPIMTGPTFGLTLWGLSDFADFENVKSNESKVLFSESDIYYRSSPDECNGYALEGFVFPIRFFSGVRKEKDGTYILDMCFRNFEASGAVFKIKVLLTEAKDYFLGLMLSKLKTSFKDISGFTLGGPSELKKEGDNIGILMLAAYPPPDDFEKKVKSKSLDY